uniref:Uncharacterized protein n=1 Tax=Cyclophora tenuis TaxID=216820 RepID=A0A6U1PVJ1_CYCTE
MMVKKERRTRTKNKLNSSTVLEYTCSYIVYYRSLHARNVSFRNQKQNIPLLQYCSNRNILLSCPCQFGTMYSLARNAQVTSSRCQLPNTNNSNRGCSSSRKHELVHATVPHDDKNKNKKSKMINPKKGHRRTLAGIPDHRFF